MLSNKFLSYNSKVISKIIEKSNIQFLNIVSLTLSALLESDLDLQIVLIGKQMVAVQLGMVQLLVVVQQLGVVQLLGAVQR